MDLSLSNDVGHNDAAAQAAQDEIDMIQAASKIPKAHPLLLEIDWSDVQLGSKVGVGGFSHVYQVTSDKIDGHGGKQFALKCLKPLVMKDKSLFQVAAADLAAEAGILSRLDHRNIVKLHALTSGGPKKAFSGKDPRGYFLVVDLLTGGTLKTKLEEFRKTQGKTFGGLAVKGSHSKMIQRLKTIGLGVAQGLEYLHEKNVHYRDLKPENVGLDSKGTPVLFDFGFAREAHFLTKGEMAGSLRYMPPEVALGKGSTLTSDTYSFGVLLWELLTLKKPFARVSKFRDLFMEQVYMKDYRPSTGYIPSNIIRDLIERCWHPDPHQRLSMDEVVKNIQVEIANSERFDFPSPSSPLAISYAKSMLNLSFSKRDKFQNVTDLLGKDRRNFSWSDVPEAMACKPQLGGPRDEVNLLSGLTSSFKKDLQDSMDSTCTLSTITTATELQQHHEEMFLDNGSKSSLELDFLVTKPSLKESL